MRKIASIAGLVLAATALGGCQSIFGSDSAQADIRDLDMSEYFEQRLAMGRAHLAAGRPTKAIVAFRQASYDPRFAGEAFNGMAIAYDRIGRADLAARYFAQAVKAAPGDERFARNLARFEGHSPRAVPFEEEPIELAVKGDAAPDIRGPITVETRNIQVASPVKVEQAPKTRVARVSPGQVAIGAAAASAVRTAAVEEPARITVETGQSARRLVQRVRRNAQARKAYPIRIVLNDANSRRP